MIHDWAIRRWPIRIRLVAAFTVMMALVLLGVAAATLAHTRASLDGAVTESVTNRLRELQPVAATAAPELAGDSEDTGAQVLDHTGRLIAGSPALADRPELAGAELDAATRGPIVLDHPHAGDLPGPVRIAAAPTTATIGAPAGNGARVIVAAASLADRDRAVAHLFRELAIGFPLVLLAAAAGAYLLAVAALRPVERMRARAATIPPTATGPAARLPVPATSDEIARLGTTFNDLLDRLRAALARERAFVADASHELRTPLGMLTTELELALRRPRHPDQLTAALRSALEETDRLSRLATDLLLLARTDQTTDPATTAGTAGGTASQPAPAARLRPVLDTVLARYRLTDDRAGGGTVTVTVDCPADLVVCADPDDLDRAISNLLDNARRHGHPPIVITAFPAPVDNGGPAVRVQVRDHGRGFDPGFLPRAFDRFTRADPARTGGGTGLGLSIVAALATRNHGQATAANHPDGGALLTLTLPAAQTTTPGPAPAQTTSSRSG